MKSSASVLGRPFTGAYRFRPSPRYRLAEPQRLRRQQQEQAPPKCQLTPRAGSSTKPSYRVREPAGLGGRAGRRWSWAWLSHRALGEKDLFLSRQASGLAPRCSASTPAEATRPVPPTSPDQVTWCGKTRGFSSAGRASALQAEGQGFKSPKLHRRSEDRFRSMGRATCLARREREHLSRAGYGRDDRVRYRDL